LWSCHSKSEQETSDFSSLTKGKWKMVFSISTPDSAVVEVPVSMQIDASGKVSILNGTEVIGLDSITVVSDSFHVKMPYFHTHLHGKFVSADSISGFWRDDSRKNYIIPFHATVWNEEDNVELNSFKRTYDVTFSPKNLDDMYKAVGLFTADGKKISGTFMTETGDYRYLSGEINFDAAPENPNFYLSCFDGTHLFLFNGQMEGDSIRNGMFYSGKHWSEPWNGRIDALAKLKDPDSLTWLKDGETNLRFSARNLNGDTVAFGEDSFRGRVSVIQLFGSWCPNCSDESIYMKELYQKYSTQGLQIIPVAFERGEDFARNSRVVRQQFEELGLPYSPYIGGQSSKDDAGRVFPMLNKVMSFPTLILVDKKGVVRKIHTGFYGPGTGDYYAQHTSKISKFLEQLLAEQ
jgi:thiol-disulfide isomerase/thioredoxin